MYPQEVARELALPYQGSGPSWCHHSLPEALSF